MGNRELLWTFVCVRNQRKLVKKISLVAVLKMLGRHKTRAWRIAKELLYNSVKDLDSGEGMTLGTEVKGQIGDLLKQAVMRF